MRLIEIKPFTAKQLRDYPELTGIRLDGYESLITLFMKIPHWQDVIDVTSSFLDNGKVVGKIDGVFWDDDEDDDNDSDEEEENWQLYALYEFDLKEILEEIKDLPDDWQTGWYSDDQVLTR